MWKVGTKRVRGGFKNFKGAGKGKFKRKEKLGPPKVKKPWAEKQGGTGGGIPPPPPYFGVWGTQGKISPADFEVETED